MTTILNDVNLPAVGELIGAIKEEPSKADTLWQATVVWNGGFRSEARIRDFAPVPSDEPFALGGDNTAPNPVEQLLGALGNCLVVGYASNATAAGIELKSVTVDLEGDLDLHTFLGLAAGNAGYETIKAQVSIESDAPAEQIEELHRKVTGTSPVGHTLSRSVPVAIELV